MNDWHKFNNPVKGEQQNRIYTRKPSEPCAACYQCNLYLNKDRVPHWISVKDRLPELEDGIDAEQFLIYHVCPVTKIKKFGTSFFWKEGSILNDEIDSGFDLPGVTHWMPLPEGPESYAASQPEKE